MDALTPPDEHFMSLAIAQAFDAERAGEIPVGAVVVKEGKVVAVGRNRTIEWNDPSAHAEVVALREAAHVLGSHRMSGLELFVTLEPCAMCSGAIFHSRLARVVFGASDPKTGCAGSVVDLFAIGQLNHHTEVVGGVLSEQCAALLDLFFKRRRQLKVTHSQPLREDALRTPMTAFSELRSIPLPDHYFYSSDGFRVHYQHLKSGAPSKIVLCIHDLPYWSYELAPWISRLQAMADCTLIAPDLIGCGLSDKPKKANWHSALSHASYLKELLSGFELLPVWILVFGSSLPIAEALFHMLDSSTAKLLHVRLKETSRVDSGHPSELEAVSKTSPWIGKNRRFIKGVSPEVRRYTEAPFPDRGYAAVLSDLPLFLKADVRESQSRYLSFDSYRDGDGLSLQSLDSVLLAIQA